MITLSPSTPTVSHRGTARARPSTGLEAVRLYRIIFPALRGALHFHPASSTSTDGDGAAGKQCIRNGGPLPPVLSARLGSSTDGRRLPVSLEAGEGSHAVASRLRSSSLGRTREGERLRDGAGIKETNQG